MDTERRSLLERARDPDTWMGRLVIGIIASSIVAAAGAGGKYAWDHTYFDCHRSPAAHCSVTWA